MSVGYADASPLSFAGGTGAGLYDAAWLYPDELEADRRRTHITPANIADPVLRDVLVGFHGGLIHQLADIAIRISVPNKYGGADSARPVPTGYAGFWLPAIYLVAPFVSTVPDPMISALGSFTAWSAAGVHVQAVAAPTSAAILPVSDPDSMPSTPAPLAVEAVQDVADWLGLPVADVLAASRIRKRTYHAWKKGTRRPRLASQGELWELRQLAADLVETMGMKGARTWVGQPTVRDLLRTGDVDALANRAYATGAAPRPAWVGAGSIESHAISVGPGAVGPMDPNDVVEPGP